MPKTNRIEEFKRWEIGEPENLSGSTNLKALKASKDPIDQAWVKAKTWSEIFRILKEAGYTTSAVILSIEYLRRIGRRNLANVLTREWRKHGHILP